MLQVELFVRRIIYVLLLALAPGFIFAVQVVLFVPTALIFVGLLRALWTQLSSGTLNALGPVGFALAHFLLLAGLYWLIAFLLAKLVVFFRQPSTSRLVLSLLLLGIVGVSQLSIFGGGGHGASDFGPVQSLFKSTGHFGGRSMLLYAASVLFFASVAFVLSVFTQRRAAS